jgi:hypothetical protein
MGKLKQLVIDLDKDQVDFTMKHYELFLQKAMLDKSMPNTWQDAINAIHWAAYISGVDLGRIQIEYIINQQTESLYESD